MSEAAPMDEAIRRGLLRLEEYIHDEQYSGYDPYDVLTSPLFTLPIARSSRVVRLSAQQVVRRLPVNVRPLLRIPKGRNPVTYGLCLNAYARLRSVFPEKDDFYRRQAEYCIQQLLKFRSNGYSGACWGYDFDWEGRYARIPAFTPTVVATGIVADGLFAAYRLLAIEEANTLLQSASTFVLKDLRKSWDGDSFCFSYSPFDTQSVFNATMKGARLLVQAYVGSKDPILLEEARNTVRYVLRHQRSDGSWPYSAGDARTWSDNFHTGYVLDCLHEYSRLSGDTSVNTNLARGFAFYRSRFFSPDGMPLYYHNKTYPIDATAAAQSILTLTRFGEQDFARQVASWMVKHMQDPRGFFYYRRHRYYTNRISYMRWSNAWMYLALSTLVSKTHALV